MLKHFAMSVSRRIILHDNCFAHVFFRCHNRQYFLSSNKMKNFLIELWIKYAKDCKVRFIDFNILCNHAHALLHVEDVKLLGEFMRNVNSQLAKRINKEFKRDSQAIRERYKSPLITTEKYLHDCIGYVWLNHHEIYNYKNPQDYPFCSLYHRYRGLKHPLLSSYEEFGIISPKGNERKFVREHLEICLKKNLDKDVFEHGHTIGDMSAMQARAAFIKAAKSDMAFLAEEGFT
jgi:REP element-mobilizing transposase RayT